MRKKDSEALVSVEINEVRQKLRSEITERYGSITEFLKSKAGEKFGGMKIKPYLYDTGSINFSLISRLCEFFNIGKLTRKIVITRTISYQLTKSKSDPEKTS